MNFKIWNWNSNIFGLYFLNWWLFLQYKNSFHRYIRNVLFYKATNNSGNSTELFTKPFHIAVPSVQIVGDREVHVKAGTSVTLKCLISNCLEEPAYVFWYHGDRRLLDDDDQIPGKIKILGVLFCFKSFEWK